MDCCWWVGGDDLSRLCPHSSLGLGHLIDFADSNPLGNETFFVDSLTGALNEGRGFLIYSNGWLRCE